MWFDRRRVWPCLQNHDHKRKAPHSKPIDPNLFGLSSEIGTFEEHEEERWSEGNRKHQTKHTLHDLPTKELSLFCAKALRMRDPNTIEMNGHFTSFGKVPRPKVDSSPAERYLPAYYRI